MKVNPESDQFANIPVHTTTDTVKPAGGGFQQVLGGALSIAGQLASGVAGAHTMGLGPLAGSLLGGLAGGGAGGAVGGVPGFNLGNDPSPADLLQLQNQIQRESLVFNAQTNISKTDHETRMSAIRNVKAG